MREKGINNTERIKREKLKRKKNSGTQRYENIVQKNIIIIIII